MRVVCGVAAALIAAAGIVCGVTCASAQTDADADDNRYPIDSYLLDQRLPAHFDHDPLDRVSIEHDLAERFLFFSGIDLWHGGNFAHGGMVWSPDGLDREGFTFKLLVGGGRYQYRSGSTEITGYQELGAAMPGWRFKFDHLEIVALAGVDVQVHQLLPDDPGNRLRGTRVGMRVGADLWYQPNDAMMATVSASASTLGSNVWARGALGLRFFDLAWIGPEAQAFADAKYRQYRAGLHATAFLAGAIEWSVGVGYAQDSDHRSGAYGRVGLLTRR